MRIGEKLNILNEVLNDAGQIVLTADPIYGGQAYTVRNFRSLVEALQIVSQETWNDVVFEPVQAIIAKFISPPPQAVNIGLDDYNAINSYVQAVNEEVPVYVSVLESLTQNQRPQAINIKLPEKYRTLADLTSLNNRLTKLFKIIEIDGKGITFEGFDTGTDWYTIGLIGAETYHAFLAALKIAQEFFIARSNYFKSEQAKWEYESARASMSAKPDYTADELEQYKEKRMDRELEEKSKPVVEQIVNANGHADHELLQKVIQEVKGLIKEMGDGVEFHLSLNPPDYAKEEAGLITIDYVKIASESKKATAAKTAKELDGPKEKESK